MSVALLNAAKNHMRQGNLRDAAELLFVVLAENPAHLEALTQLMDVARRLRDTEVLSVAVGAVGEPTGGWEIDVLCAKALRTLGRHADSDAFRQRAEQVLQAGIDAHPDDWRVLKGMGNLLRDFGSTQQAVDVFNLAFAHAPEAEKAGILNDRGMARRAGGDPALAIDDFREAIARNANHPQAHSNLALVLLLLEQYEEGWGHYEWRPKGKPQAPIVQPGVARNTVLLVAEQGLGDQIQMARYAKLLTQRGAGRVVVQCDPKLVELFQSGCDGITQAIAQGQDMPPHDLAIPIMSLPLAFQTKSWSIPDKPYLHPDLQRHVAIDAAVAEALGSGNPRKKIGFVWAGNPFNAENHNRSCPLAAFAPLVQIPDTTWFSLQVGLRPGEAEQLAAMGAYDLEAAVAASFADTAAVVAQLDFLVTVDTAVAHLAGALGKLVLVALPFDPDWRWLRSGERTPWYPSARLFRQRQPGDWPGVIQDIRTRVEGWMRTRAV